MRLTIFKVDFIKTMIEQPEIRILHADDDIDDRQFFEKALNEISIPTRYKSVNNGELLMDYLLMNSLNLPDILFLDLSMPRKTGFECLTEIKEDEKLKNLQVIVFTTSFKRNDEFEFKLSSTLIKLGAHSYYAKPASFENLKQVLQNAIVTVMEKS